jgi:hypothetical protein
MRRMRAHRKGVSTIIGGIIILTLILTALTEMVLVAQQYDTYETLLNTMSQKDIDRMSENLIAIYPGITGPQLVSGCGSTCNQYNMSISNLAGIGTQIVRIYINSTSGCDNLCVFNPSTSPTQFGFQFSSSFINPAEAGHGVLFWLPNNVNLPTDSPKANTVVIATARGRTFTVQWPFPPAGNYIPTDLHLDMGPIRITFDPNLITFTANDSNLPQYNVPGKLNCAGTQPASAPCLLAGGWTVPIPTGSGLVFYLRLSNIGTGTVELLDRSYILARGWKTGAPSSLDVQSFYIVRPMSAPSVGTCWSNYFAFPSYWDATWPSSGGCSTPIGSTAFKVYNFTQSKNNTCSSANPCYTLPNGPYLGIPGQSVYVLFSAATPASGALPTTASKLTGGDNYVLFLQLCYLYLGYEYSVTIPLISVVASPK